MRPLRALLLLLTLAATGCASAPPAVVEAPLPPPPERWSASQTDPAAIGADWLKSFEDPQLTLLVAEALEHNPEIRAAVARLDQAASLARIAGADLSPQVSASLGASRRRTNFIGLPIPGATGGVFSTTNPTYGVSLDVSWELDIWGRIRAGQSAAMADLQGAEATLQGARLSLAAQTAKAWYTLHEAARQRALARETVDSFERADKGVHRRYLRGSSPPLDLRLSRGNVASARALVALREQQLDAAARQLEILLGRYPAAEIEAATQLPPVPQEIPAGLPAELVSRRPDLVLAERRLAAAGARVKQARASLYPRLSLTTSGGTSTPELENLLDPDFKVWNVAANLLQPIFQGGRLRENVRLNQARMREAAESFSSTLLRAYGEVETGLAVEKHLASREAALADAAHHSRAARQLAEEQYRAGIIGILPMLEAQRRALAAEGEWISVRRERLTRRIDLHLALGGSFVVPEATAPQIDETSSGDISS